VVAGFQVAIEIFAAQSQFNPFPGSTIQGNKIGTDVTGETVLGNDVGIYINGVPRNRIGGTTPGSGNVISGNTTAIYLLGSTTTGNQIEGNLIGLDAAGKLPLGNYIGIFLDGASSNTIGGTAAGARNYIAGDKRNGVDGSTGVFVFNKALNNQIVNNSIGAAVDGRSGKGLGMGDYGVLLFNAPKNVVPRSGKTRNRIVGSGIAAFREFTGSTSRGKSGASVPQAASVARVPHGPAGLQRR
jgi:titin